MDSVDWGREIHVFKLEIVSRAKIIWKSFIWVDTLKARSKVWGFAGRIFWDKTKQQFLSVLGKNIWEGLLLVYYGQAL